MLMSSFFSRDALEANVLANSCSNGGRARDVAVEFFTLSKSWRAGALAGTELVAALARIKIPRLRRRCRWRPSPRWKGQQCVRDIERGADGGAAKNGGAKIPEQYAHLGSLEFAKRLLQEAKVCVSPGVGFGDYGDIMCASR